MEPRETFGYVNSPTVASGGSIFAARRISWHPNGTPASAPSPLLPDELAMLPEIAAIEKVPEHIASALAARRLYINAAGEPRRWSSDGGASDLGAGKLALTRRLK